eukprot:Gb_05035 [translate_table: standard]
MRLEGKVAIITGGASGIGEVAVKLFLKHGAKVVIADIQDDIGTSLAESLGPQASYFHCDVSKENEVSALVDYTLDKHGLLDIMYSNAGISASGPCPVPAMPIEDIQSLIAVNVIGAYLCTKHAARVMIPRKKGCILYTASLASLIAVATVSAAYTASKHAVAGVMKSAAANLAPYGIRVNCVSPTALPTPMFVKSMQKLLPAFDTESVAEMLERVAELKGVRLEAEDVAKAALFLCSDEARYISGHNLVIDGAFSVSKSFSTSNIMDFLPAKSLFEELVARSAA